MESKTLHFKLNVRRTFACVKVAVEGGEQFHGVKCDERNFVIRCKHNGRFLSPFGESIKIRAVATSTTETDVTVESESRHLINLVNLGANSANVSDLCDYISNRVNSQCTPEELGIRPWRGK